MQIQTYKFDSEKLIKNKIVDKKSIHENDLLHLSAHLLLIDKQGKICCRKRSKDSFRYADLWTTAIGTHVPLNSDYETLLKDFLPVELKIEKVGEFRVHDEWENEINGLYVGYIEETELPEEFMKDRKFIELNKLESLIGSNQTTPHLEEALNCLKKYERF